MIAIGGSLLTTETEWEEVAHRRGRDDRPDHSQAPHRPDRTTTEPCRTRSQGGTAPVRGRQDRGLLLTFAGAALLLGFVTAEALYPGVYTTHTNTVSHLGASEPPNSVVLQPSAAIFDITMLVTGP